MMWVDPIDSEDRWEYMRNDTSGVIVAEVRYDGSQYQAALLPRHASPVTVGAFDSIDDAKQAVVEATA